MRKIIYVLAIFFLLLSCKSKILIMGEKISQNDICVDLGYGTKCNPFPYGNSFFMNLQRSSIPIDTTSSFQNNIGKILSQFIGGQLINDNLITPNQINLKKDWYYVHSPIKLDQEFVKKNNIEVDIPLNEIIENILITEKLNVLEKKELKEKIENSYKRFSQSKGNIELLYHSVNLSGNWYNDLIKGDVDAKSIVTYNKVCVKKNSKSGKCEKYGFRNKLNDENKFIGGIGAIEYKVSKLDSLQSNIKTELKSNFGIEVAEKLSIKFTNEVQRNTTISAPKRLDVVFISTLNPKIIKDIE